MTAPNPDGCYVQVWDAPQFSGAADFINGPFSYANLRDLPGARVWRDRIRSVKVGPSAVAAVYAEEYFRGTSLALYRDTEYRQLPVALSGQIQSLHIDCSSVVARIR
jgi:hypothetical protein